MIWSLYFELVAQSRQSDVFWASLFSVVLTESAKMATRGECHCANTKRYLKNSKRHYALAVVS